MKPNFRGNYGAYLRGSLSQGVGKQQANTVLGYIAITADEAGEKYLSANSLFTSFYDQGGCLQAVGSAVEVSFTLENADFATDETANKKGLVHWCNSLTVSPDKIETFPIPAFSAMKIKFTAPGILYIATR